LDINAISIFVSCQKATLTCVSFGPPLAPAIAVVGPIHAAFQFPWFEVIYFLGLTQT
jgi:hypothetical protein